MIIHRLGKISSNNIYILREDLLPIAFGGNKVRIVEQYIEDALRNNKDCIIGYGSISSNLCRVLANMCAQKKMKCYIIYCLDDDEEYSDTVNCKLVKIVCDNIYYCRKFNVADTVEKVINDCINKGLKPYYIYGDKYGKGNEMVGVSAYADVYKQIQDYALKNYIKFDYIFLASGTGTTQAGLEVGKIKFSGNEQIIGISVARQTKLQRDIINNLIQKSLLNSYNCSCNIVDEYLCGGYGKYNSTVKNVILDVYKKYGILMDVTYVGKAYYGMCEYLKNNYVFDKNILFIHTGGTPLVFDRLDIF